MSKELVSFQQSGVEYRKTPPYHHESNGLPEPFNRTIITAARAMITDDNFLKLWAEAITTAVFLKNNAPHSALDIQGIPFNALLHKKPNVTHLHLFGI
jgi:hypothetical protein